MKKVRKIIIILLIVAAVIGGIGYGLHNLKMKNQSSKTAGVYPVMEIGYDASMMWDNSALNGSVKMNSEQRIYLASNQQVSEVKVVEGQQVKAGDVLLVYDVTSQNLQLELQRTELEISRVNIVNEQRELEELKGEKAREELPEPQLSASPTDAEQQAFYDYQSTPTREELNEQIQSKQNSIKDAQLRYEMDKLSLEMAELQNGNGEVYANFDGFVKSMIGEGEAASSGQPMIVIGASEGYVVEAQIGELALGTVQIGDQVSMYCYDNGMNYTGTITEVSMIPVQQSDGYFGYGSKVESYYPMTIALEEGADVSQNMYMEITLENKPEDTAGGFYLSKAFLKQEGANYYVMKDVDGVLKKTYVKVGSKQMGDSILILGGITMNDYIAFPYLDEAEEGVKTVQKSVEELYGY